MKFIRFLAQISPVEWCIIVVSAGLLLAIVCSAAGNTGRDAYDAWCKLEHRTDITYEEWRLLRNRDLLQHK
jgi:hypothetical protein